MATMRPNPASSVARAQRATRAERAAKPPAAAVALRPLGYLLIGLVWAALSVVALALPVALPAGLVSTGAGPTSEILGRFDPLLAILSIVFFGGFIAPLLGYVFLALPFACIPLAVLSFTYVGRSLRPSYRHERLSTSEWSCNVIGPVTVLPTALSLLPVRITPWTRFWAGLYVLGWVPGRALLIAAVPAGIGYFVTVIWILWPLHSIVAIVIWALVSAAIVAVVVVLVVRAARQRLGGLRPAPERE
ncbi:hypothetical protein [Pseudolysinimonas sp.]|uniref:hypothetical protein n=1 Tax=Pseudolysinimonas sp. TaxID=2680009 RepID=UPI003F7E9427